MAKHRDNDELVKGQYWEGGKGCAIGCTIYSGRHEEYETRFGIPQMLAHLEDRIFEGLPNAKAKEWPIRFMSAIEPGADLSRVGWQFLHWLLTDETVNPGIAHPLVRDSVKQCADVLVPLTKGEPVDRAAALRALIAVRNAARSTEYSAAWSAESAENATRMAGLAWSAVSAASAMSVACAALSVACAARRAAYVRMSEKLIELLQAAPAEARRMKA